MFGNATCSMPRARWGFSVAFAVLLAGCDPVQPEDRTAPDAGVRQPVDDGATGGSPDTGGVAPDAGAPAPDAGDAAPADAGLGNDPGPGTPDAGEPVADAGGTEPDPGNSGSYHPAGWATPGSGNFHGDAAKQGLSACEGCHGASLDYGVMSCNACHSGWKTNCTFCHGGQDNGTGAPPRDTHGRTAKTEVTVGAHTAHVMATQGLAAALTCSACHTVPADAMSNGHIDGSPAEVTIAGWNRTAQTCASTYCHGNFTGGNTANAPKWTGTNQAACGTCHGISPRTGHHPANFSEHRSRMGTDCTWCHGNETNTSGSAISDVGLHMNGTKDVSIRNGRWDAATKTCYPSCHGGKRW